MAPQAPGRNATGRVRRLTGCYDDATKMLHGSYRLVGHVRRVACMLRGSYEETAPVEFMIMLALQLFKHS